MNSEKIEVYVEICRDGAKIPKYANVGDAGMDIYAAEDITILPGETKVIPTGLKIAVPDGYELQVRPRSGISLKTPLRISNSPGTIDSGYRDELGIIMSNTSQGENNTVLGLDSTGNKNGTYKIKQGDRVAQIILKVVPKMMITVVNSVNDIGSNRGGGFGSTGIK